MQTYWGQRPADMFCPDIESMKKILDEGQWFKTQSVDYYFRAERCNIRKPLPENVYCLRRLYRGSKTAMVCGFYQLVENKDAKIYAGDELQDQICLELRAWANALNEKMKAFSGRDFASFLRAIPDSIFDDQQFQEKMRGALKESFAKRKRRKDSLQVEEIKNRALEIFDNQCDTRAEKGDLIETRAKNTFEDVVKERGN